jgi:hypothetical protein
MDNKKGKAWENVLDQERDKWQALVKAVMNVWKWGKFLTILSTLSFSRSILLHDVSRKHCGTLRLYKCNTFEKNNVRGCKENTQYCAAYKIQKKKMGGACSVARMGERRGVYRVLVGTPEGNRPLRRPSVDWSIILRWIFRKWDVGVWTGSSWLRTEKGDGHW